MKRRPLLPVSIGFGLVAVVACTLGAALRWDACALVLMAAAIQVAVAGCVDTYHNFNSKEEP